MQPSRIESGPKSLPNTMENDLLWGAQAIGEFIGKDEAQVCYLARRGLLPIKKVGVQLVARKSTLLEAL